MSTFGTGVWTLFLRPMRRIGHIRDEFPAIQPGDTEASVRRKLTSATLIESPLSAPFWDQERLNGSAEAEIVYSIGQKIDTFFLPVTVVISFDKSGKAVGKHIYD